MNIFKKYKNGLFQRKYITQSKVIIIEKNTSHSTLLTNVSIQASLRCEAEQTKQLSSVHAQNKTETERYVGHIGYNYFYLYIASSPSLPVFCWSSWYEWYGRSCCFVPKQEFKSYIDRININLSVICSWATEKFITKTNLCINIILNKSESWTVSIRWAKEMCSAISWSNFAFLAV